MDVKKIRNKIPVLTLLSAIAVLALGILLLFLTERVVEWLVIFSVILLLYIYGTLSFLSGIGEMHIERGAMAMAISWSAATILLYLGFEEGVGAVLTSILIGIVALVMGLLRTLICINCIVNEIPGRLRNGISAVLCLAFALFLLIHPINNFSLLSMVAGFYLIFYAVTMFGDAFAAIFRTDLGSDRLKRRIHFAVPNIITAVKPTRMIAQIDRLIEAGKLDHGMLIEEKADHGFDHVNMEVLVHLTTQGTNKFGHVDIAIGETVYSYGTYDESKIKFGGLVAQGTLIAVPKIPYLKYCLDYQKKYVIGFGACLSEKQLATITSRIEDTIKDNAELLESEYEKAVKSGGDGSEHTDSASNIARLGGKVWTITGGMFRRYFGINTNCVRFADWLLSDSGIDAISFSGLRTPGAYYDMLENMFRRKNTRVIRKISYIISKDIRYVEKLSEKSEI